ncbi:MAG: hypothetical protein WC623_24660 [Pedobacter sp.]|uniref:hypothetical protein n=1 Tax=Pedobacter sp. TaxID=1411316 RepID=UPI00356546D5
MMEEIQEGTIKRVHDRIDAVNSTIDKNFEKMFDFFKEFQIWKAETNVRLQPLIGLETKHAVVEGKVSTIGKVLWGVGAAALSSLGWLFSQVIGGKH